MNPKTPVETFPFLAASGLGFSGQQQTKKRSSAMKKHSLIPAICALPLAILLTSSALAEEPRRMYNVETGQYDTNPEFRERPSSNRVAPNSRPGAVPRRIYDLESQNYITNPDYHEPRPVANVVRTGEPRRMYNAETGQYDTNPDYHDPVAAVPHTHRTNAEPRRIFDLESQNYVANPSYHHSSALTGFARREPQTREPSPITSTAKGPTTANRVPRVSGNGGKVTHRTAPRPHERESSARRMANGFRDTPIAADKSHLITG
jgi:hypothetical protein